MVTVALIDQLASRDQSWSLVELANLFQVQALPQVSAQALALQLEWPVLAEFLPPVPVQVEISLPEPGLEPPPVWETVLTRKAQPQAPSL